MTTIKQFLIDYAVHVLLVLTIVALGYLCIRIYQDKRAEEGKFQNLIGSQDQYKQITKDLAQLETKYESEKQLNAELKQNWKQVEKSKDEEIQSLTKEIFAIPSQNANLKVQVEASQLVDKYTGKTRVLTKAWLLNDTSGLKTPLPVIAGDIEVDPVNSHGDKHFMFWAPRYEMGFDSGVSGRSLAFKPSLGISLAGYGYDSHDMDFRFAQFGFDFDSHGGNIGVNVVPVELRPFSKTLPNTYIGPGIGIDQQGTEYFINVSVGL